MGSPIIRRDELESILDRTAERILSEVAALLGVSEPELVEEIAEPIEPAEAPEPEAEPAKPRKGRKPETAPGQTPDILSGLDESDEAE